MLIYNIKVRLDPLPLTTDLETNLSGRPIDVDHQVLLARESGRRRQESRASLRPKRVGQDSASFQVLGVVPGQKRGVGRHRRRPAVGEIGDRLLQG